MITIEVYECNLGGEMQKQHAVSIRMPIKLYEMIKENAKRDHRSISQQIIIALEKGFEKEKASA